jgi:cytochrome c oxidase subunit 2
MLALATGVVAVVLLLLLALFRPRHGPPPPRDEPVAGNALGEAGEVGLVVVAGIAIPAVILTGLLVFAVRTLSALAAPPAAAMTVEVIGHLWWWEVRYPDHGITTANEIHIPVGQPVQLQLASRDVIHSFWVPQLMGKLDLVPGRTNITWVEAAQPGRYRGQCAEFCGLQHARMAFLVIAEPPDQFAAWLEEQRRPATEPADPTLLMGARAFAREGCITCHVIRYGSGAVGTAVGPDLTHVGSRRTLAAGTLPNTQDTLARWIDNPQAVKPGSYMPNASMDPQSLRALAAYLGSLK